MEKPMLSENLDHDQNQPHKTGLYPAPSKQTDQHIAINIIPVFIGESLQCKQ
jgi:hypothetical protein